MNLVSVSEKLTDIYSISMCDLDIFSETGAISVAQWQPCAEINFSRETGFRCGDELHKNKARKFLNLIKDDFCSLAITPEYSFPFQVLHEIISDSSLWPEDGKLWCFGMEGISTKDFIEFAEMQKEKVIIANINILVRKPFCGVIIYLFKNYEQLILLPQLKIQPASDKFNEFENAYMSLGTDVYVFKKEGKASVLASLICADALTQGVEKFNNDYPNYKILLLNPQLNPSLIHSAFTFSLKRFLNFSNNFKIITLNWSNKTKIVAQSTCAKITHGFSAFYKNCSSDDYNLELIRKNNKYGLIHGINEHISVWHTSYDEHIIEYFISPLITALIDGPLQKKLEPTGNKFFRFEKDDWEKRDDFCCIDWGWVESIFQIKCPYQNCTNCDVQDCKFYELEIFLNTFFNYKDSEYKILNGQINSVAYKLPSDLEISTVSSIREILGCIIENIKENKFPKRFSHFSNNNKFTIGKENINISTIQQSSKMMNDAWFVFIGNKWKAVKIIKDMQKQFGEECIDRIILCYASNKGYEYYEEHENIFCNIGSTVVNEIYAN